MDKVCALNSLYFSVKLEDGMDPIPASFYLRKNSIQNPLTTVSQRRPFMPSNYTKRAETVAYVPT